jgi:hypothetical protein
MQVYGVDSVRSELESGGYVVKLVANDRTAVVFPRTSEHRDIKMSGLTYGDDSKGNALAAMLSPGRLEFRHHRAFSDERVKRIAEAILEHPDMAFARGSRVTYQGRVLIGQAQGLGTKPTPE